jgi:hypothetical protein
MTIMMLLRVFKLLSAPFFVLQTSWVEAGRARNWLTSAVIPFLLPFHHVFDVLFLPDSPVLTMLTAPIRFNTKQLFCNEHI